MTKNVNWDGNDALLARVKALHVDEGMTSKEIVEVINADEDGLLGKDEQITNRQVVGKLTNEDCYTKPEKPAPKAVKEGPTKKETVDMLEKVLGDKVPETIMRANIDDISDLATMVAGIRGSSTQS